MWDRLKKQSRVDINIAPNDVMDMDALGECDEKVNLVGTPKIDDEELGVSIAWRSVKS